MHVREWAEAHNSGGKSTEWDATVDDLACGRHRRRRRRSICLFVCFHVCYIFMLVRLVRILIFINLNCLSNAFMQFHLFHFWSMLYVVCNRMYKVAESLFRFVSTMTNFICVSSTPVPCHSVCIKRFFCLLKNCAAIISIAYLSLAENYLLSWYDVTSTSTDVEVKRTTHFTQWMYICTVHIAHPYTLYYTLGFSDEFGAASILM